MAQGFIIFKDLNTDPLFDGSEIYAYVQSVVIAGANNIDSQFRSNQDPSVIGSDNSNIGSMWNRRKNNLQDTGAENLQITLVGGWETNQIGSELENGQINLSPHKIMRMALSGRTFSLRGGTAIQYLLDGEQSHSSDGSTFYINGALGSGIPVHIASWSIEDSAAQQEYVSWNMGLIEDKDEINLTN